MNIFILRHGQAEPQQTTDAVRQLTEKGRADTAKIISARLMDLQSVTQIWASSLVRAQQTAEIAAKYFPHIPIQTSELLVPEANPLIAMNWLQAAYMESSAVLLVSHQPFVGEFINTLCGKPTGFYPMGTSSLAAVEASVIATAMGKMLWLDHA